ncbi:uncharacterized protein LOC120169971 isoform X2 [Hibiscus syriacus]|uniref:uncharacterized protein LOC120169971 isoform X2 n=1 Tax=Hibiscus syriacus TaxID=106335 RepID=UPI001920D856|nr:uncharacterized protein LOC120169971 isoform X2 [Hibiscus syriacus]
MRFSKGSKVEVLIKEEVPTGAWRCAEIISGNGHTYSVRYGCFPFTGEAGTVERVLRKAIRPCPPPINGTVDWFPGDIVEVFDDLCWKSAVMVTVFGGNNFSVRILGSNLELEVHRSRLRVRQSWEDGKWFLVGKGSSNSSHKRKRSSIGFSGAGGQKKRAIEKGSFDGKRIIVRFPSPASEKVDAFVSPNSIRGERCTPSSFYRIDDTGDTLSCASSVGSCSGVGNNGLNLSPYITNDCENLDDSCSVVDTYCERKCGEEASSGGISEGLGMDFRRLELHAYQQALEALYASGPLTWEEEANSISLSLLEASIYSFKSHDWV